MLTERHLQIFVALADEQHFGDAARVVGITQPPLSQGLRRLESLVGAKLFERGAGSVELTPAGAALLPYARRALASMEELHQAAVSRDPEGPEIRLGLTPEVPPASGAALAAACAAAIPGSRVTVVTSPTSTLVNQVTTGRLTLAAVQHPTVLDGLDAGRVVLLPTWALVPETRTLSSRATSGNAVSPTAPPGAVGLRELRGLPVAVRPRAEAPAARDLFMDTLALHRPDGGTVVVTDERAGLAMAAAGQAMVVTADPTLTAPGVRRYRLADDPLPLRLRLVWSRTRTPFLRPDDVMAQLTEALAS
ncbi:MULTISPECIES: LysR family transcriptional regulator [Kribbella]|uniref:HTH lysR-type domain-containing protein n=1 Tax=Kribbella karoonensis TaxID=324851 RepID=A0ABP4P193_9ACTN